MNGAGLTDDPHRKKISLDPYLTSYTKNIPRKIKDFILKV
jgi:hypothetical protein